jgi:hypothetical protein
MKRFAHLLLRPLPFSALQPLFLHLLSSSSTFQQTDF